MTVHLIKLAVGVEDVEHLRVLQQDRLSRTGRVAHVTRQHPKREAELLAGGSLYWVIKGAVRARQPVLALDPLQDEDGKRKCALVLSPDLVEVAATPHRAFQGWRYFSPEKAPPDAVAGSNDDAAAMPEPMVSDLKALGLL